MDAEEQTPERLPAPAERLTQPEIDLVRAVEAAAAGMWDDADALARAALAGRADFVPALVLRHCVLMYRPSLSGESYAERRELLSAARRVQYAVAYCQASVLLGPRWIDEPVAAWIRASIAYMARDYSEAVRLYRTASDGGLAMAQYDLGSCYGLGRGVATDTEEQLRLFRLAADKGLAGAQDSLGMHYDCGADVGRDAAEAARLYRLAADQGEARAQFHLARCYYSGLGVRADANEALRLCALAEEQGLEAAQSVVGTPCTVM